MTPVNGLRLSAGMVYPRSVVRTGGNTYFLARLADSGTKRLGIIGDASDFADPVAADAQVTLCPLTPENAAALRRRLPWLRPTPLGMRASFGFGDRIGSATPGHIQALREADPGGRLSPIFAQQSVRENARTGRTPQQVIDDAMWGVFQEGWRSPWGADADHVKELSDLETFVATGYTFFTVDPGDHVDNEAETDPLDALRAKASAAPWDLLQTNQREMLDRYCRAPIAAGSLFLVLDEPTVLRALAKYGRALAHTVAFARALDALLGDRLFDFEMSVDETDSPTSVEQHFFILSELTRCGVHPVSLAPRFVGKMQKGIDYIGDLGEFERRLAGHIAVAQHFGGYKLSLHTGSDKFSLYPLLARHAKSLIHVKTAGTSYLEALRVVALLDPRLFRRVLEVARKRFEIERKSYSLDARLSEVPPGAELADAQLPALLEGLDSRQVLHVTFGSILTEFKAELAHVLSRHEAEYHATLVRHFARHVAPFSRGDHEPQ
jgi:hypothetical protein